MLHLIKYNLLVKLKNFGTTFWPLVFPILLGTMFYFAFGNINDADFATVSVAVVRQEKAGYIVSDVSGPGGKQCRPADLHKGADLR